MYKASAADRTKSARDVYIGRLRTGMHYGSPFGVEGAKSGLAVKMLKTQAEAITAYCEWLASVNCQKIEPG